MTAQARAAVEVCSEHLQIFGVDGWVRNRPRGWTCCCGMQGPEGVRFAAPHETVEECHEASRVDGEQWAAKAKAWSEERERAETEAEATKQKIMAEAKERIQKEAEREERQHEPEKETRITVASWDALDLFNAEHLPAPVGFLKDRIFCPGTLGYIGGAGGVGKSTFELDLGFCIARGLPLGPYKTKKGLVWIVSQEMTDRQMRARLRKRFTREEIAAARPNLRFLCKAGVKINTKEGRTALRMAVSGSQGLEPIANLYGADAGTTPDFIFIDNLADVLGGADENSNQQMAPILNGLIDEVAIPLDCAVILLHHTGKASEFRTGADRLRGASCMRDVAADVLIVEKREDDRLITFEKCRDEDEEVLPLTFTRERQAEGLIVSAYVVSDEKGAAMSKLDAAVLEARGTSADGAGIAARGAASSLVRATNIRIS